MSARQNMNSFCLKAKMSIKTSESVSGKSFILLVEPVRVMKGV